MGHRTAKTDGHRSPGCACTRDAHWGCAQSPRHFIEVGRECTTNAFRPSVKGRAHLLLASDSEQRASNADTDMAYHAEITTMAMGFPLTY